MQINKAENKVKMKNNSKVSDFQMFIDVNSVKKKEVAEFLSVSQAFITQLVQGLRDIPADKLALLKHSSKWGTSMFGEVEMLRTEQKNENFADSNLGVQSNVTGNGNKVTNEVNASPKDFLEIIRKKDEQIERLLTLLEMK